MDQNCNFRIFAKQFPKFILISWNGGEQYESFLFVNIKIFEIFRSSNSSWDQSGGGGPHNHPIEYSRAKQENSNYSTSDRRKLTKKKKIYERHQYYDVDEWPHFCIGFRRFSKQKNSKNLAPFSDIFNVSRSFKILKISHVSHAKILTKNITYCNYWVEWQF